MALRGSSQPPATNRPKKLTDVTGNGNCVTKSCRSASSSACWCRRIDFNRLDLRPGQALEPLRQQFRLGGEERLRVDVAAGETFQQHRHRGIDGAAAPLGVGDDLPVGRQVAHHVEVGLQLLAVVPVGGRPQEDGPGHDRLDGRELGAAQAQVFGQVFEALKLGSGQPVGGRTGREQGDCLGR